jgi:methionyl-tRNA formyltransferase
MTRIVYMGTPEFAVPALAALDKEYEVVGVVTQPDRPAGRGRKVVASPVKGEALARELPIFQPQTLRTPEALAQLAGWRPDLIVVVAFGQILQAPVLNLPAFGCLNVHASLLPAYRGAAPIAGAILAGEAFTGVTIMRMDEGMDTGPILTQATLDIAALDTTATLGARLAGLGAQTLIETLPDWLAGRIQPQEQDEAVASYCRPLVKTDGLLDWAEPADVLDRRIRATDPWPGAYTTWRGQRLKVLNARPLPDWQGQGPPGQVVNIGSGLGVATGKGALELLAVQLAGKKPMAAAIFSQGQRGLLGGCLGT